MIITPTNTWIAAGPGQASTDANWSLGRAPITGDTVVFDATSVNNCSWDLDGLTIVPDSEALVTGYSGTVALSTDMMAGAGGALVQAGTLSGGGKWLKSQGNVRHIGGTLATSTPHIEMQGNGTTLQLSASDKIGQLKITGQSVSYKAPAGGCEVDAAFTNNGSINLTGVFNLPTHLLPSSTIGNISGSGTLSLRYYNTNATIPAINVSCTLAIWSLSSATQNAVMTMGGALACSTLSIYSLHATYTLTLNHGSNYPLTVAGLTTLGARAIMNQGTAQWSFNGGYTQNGASSVFNMGGEVVSGNVAQSDGALNGNATYFWTTSGSVAFTGGTTAHSVLNLKMTGVGVTYQATNLVRLRTMWITGDVTTIGPLYLSYSAYGSLVVDGKLHHGANAIYLWFVSQFNCSGAIDGTGYLRWECALGSFTLSPITGTINSPVMVNVESNSAASRVLTLSSALILGKTLTIQSAHASYTCTVDTAGFAIRHSGLIIGVRGAVLFKGSKVLAYGNLDTSAGSADFGTSQYIQAGPGTIKTAAGQQLNDVEAPVVGLALASDVTIAGKYRHLRDAALNGFALTYDPSKEVKMTDDGRNMAMRQARMAAIIGGAL